MRAIIAVLLLSFAVGGCGGGGGSHGGSPASAPAAPALKPDSGFGKQSFGDGTFQ